MLPGAAGLFLIIGLFKVMKAHNDNLATRNVASKVFNICDMFHSISEYLDNESLRSLYNISAQFKHWKKGKLFWQCTPEFTQDLVDKVDVREDFLKTRIRNPREQLSLGFFFFIGNPITNVLTNKPSDHAAQRFQTHRQATSQQAI